MKQVKYVLDDEGLYGFVKFGEPTIHINLERIWWETREWESFVQLYSETVLHEHLHVLIDEIVSDWKYDKEEELIRAITGEEEPWAIKRLFQVIK